MCCHGTSLLAPASLLILDQKACSNQASMLFMHLALPSNFQQGLAVRVRFQARNDPKMSVVDKMYTIAHI